MVVILVVEDDPIIRDEIENAILSIDNNIKVINADDGKTALKVAQSISVDVFILDIGLPDYDGLELAKDIRKTYLFNPIIIQSSNSEASYQQEVHDQIENLAYLSKPYSKQKLVEKIKRSLKVAHRLGSNQLKIKQNGFCRIIDIKDILFIEKVKGYKNVEICFYDQNLNRVYREELLGISLNSIIDMLSYKCDLLRCHKSYIVNPKAIKKLNYAENTISLNHTSYKVPIGKTYKTIVDAIL